MEVLHFSRISGLFLTTLHYNKVIPIFIAVFRVRQEEVVEADNFVCGLLIDPEDGGIIFLHNIRSFSKDKVLQCRHPCICSCVENGARGC
jgi:hypothetical protein